MKDGHGLFYTARAAAPTVTLPRIKALVSGTPPTFVDVVVNLAAGEMHEANFIDNFISKPGKDGKSKRTAVFYGDETWLKMLPDVFARSEGTTSFYVTVCCYFQQWCYCFVMFCLL